MKAIVLGATSGIGKSIAQNLRGACKKVVSLGSKDVDTSSLESVEEFCKKYHGPNILVLNTGGPPDKKFEELMTKTGLKTLINFSYHSQIL